MVLYYITMKSTRNVMNFLSLLFRIGPKGFSGVHRALVPARRRAKHELVYMLAISG